MYVTVQQLLFVTLFQLVVQPFLLFMRQFAFICLLLACWCGVAAAVGIDKASPANCRFV
jgi:hypothetical protein